MEVVLLVVAVIGIALVVVPRVQRRRSTSARRPASVSRRASVTTSPARAGRRRGPGRELDALGPGVRRGRRLGRRSRLGGRGLARARRPRGVGALAGPRARLCGRAPRPRCRASSAGAPRTATTTRPGTTTSAGKARSQRVASSNGHGPLNGNGFNGNGNGAHPVTAAGPVTRIRDVAASAARRPGSSGAPNANGAAVQTAPRRKSRSIHPVLLVAVYAAAGIGLVVLASTFLLGGSSGAEGRAHARQAADAAGGADGDAGPRGRARSTSPTRTRRPPRPRRPCASASRRPAATSGARARVRSAPRAGRPAGSPPPRARRRRGAAAAKRRRERGRQAPPRSLASRGAAEQLVAGSELHGADAAREPRTDPAPPRL